MKTFDFVCIGGGPGGIGAAVAAAQEGKKVAIIEPDDLGGTCLNHGCIPKKIMYQASRLKHQIQSAQALGISSFSMKTEWLTLITNRDAYIKKVQAGYSSSLEKHNISLFKSLASFVDKNTVTTSDGQQISSDYFCISTGSRAIRPEGFSGITSYEFFKMQEQPSTVLIVGGGYIGVELAYIMQGLGTKTYLIMRDDFPLPSFDIDIRRHLFNNLTQRGIICFPSTSVTEELGKTITLSNGSKIHDVDQIIWCIGRTPNTESLNLPVISLSKSENGFISVDQHYRTNADSVFAVGDVNGLLSLASSAVRQGRHVARTLFKKDYTSNYREDLAPTAVFTDPPIAKIGLTEEQARSAFSEVKVYKSNFLPLSIALTSQSPRTLIKLVTVGKEEKVVGFHMIGESADEIAQMTAVCMHMNVTKKDLEDTLAIHPTVAEEIVTIK